MKWLKGAVSLLTAVTAATAIALVLSIYFGYSGTGQMYTPETVSQKLHILVWPLGAWLILSAVTAIAGLKTPDKPQFAKKQSCNTGRKARIAALAVSLLCALWMLFYLANTGNFASRELEMTVGKMLVNILPAALVMPVCAFFMQKDASPKPQKTNRKQLLAVRIAVAAIALALIAAGIINGGTRDVFVKAINICTECIGLG